MKKVFLFFAVALTFAACGPKASTETKTEEVPAVETPAVETPAVDTVAVVATDSVAA